MGGYGKAMKNILSLISLDYIDCALLFIGYKNGSRENTKKTIFFEEFSSYSYDIDYYYD